MLVSIGYDKRFINEYNELCEKVFKLRKIVLNYNNLDFTTECSFDELYNQLNAMYGYKHAIESRSDFKRLIENGLIEWRTEGGI